MEIIEANLAEDSFCNATKLPLMKTISVIFQDFNNDKYCCSSIIDKDYYSFKHIFVYV